MDQQHPIPQDVTGFQFKLIGDMTVKQFVYLAVGVVLAWLTFSTPLYWFIKLPFVFLFGGLGVCLAFVPIEGRPFDVMLMHFLKAFITPNQYVFQKMGHPIFPASPQPKKVVQKPKEKEQEQHESADKLQKYLNSIHTTSKNALDDREMRFLGTLPLKQGAATSVFSNSSSQPTIISSSNNKMPSTAPVQEMRTVAAQPIQVAQQNAPILVPQAAQPISQQTDIPNADLEKEAAIIQQELAEAKEEEVKQQNTQTGTVAHEKVIELEKELSNILSQKEKLQNQLVTLKKELQLQKQQVFTPSAATNGPVKQTTQNVRIIPQGQGKAAGLIAPDVPNLLTGIIKDPRGNTLPNILVEVKDRDGNPVRAFKTNGLGQFAAATQLANGVYTIAFEDPTAKNTFDTVEIPVTGVIISPLEIISVDERESLRKELFK